MYSKEDINALYEKIAHSIDISEKLFDQAEEYYKKLGAWMDEETPNYRLTVYAQGSFALGTVIKPITEADDYDLDLVCEFADHYGLDARSLKVGVIKPLLDNFDEVTKIEEKRRCWQVIYKNASNFHMDIIPSVDEKTFISITDKNVEYSSYEFIGSNPKGYINWFNGRKAIRYKAIREAAKSEQIQKFMAEVEPLKEYKLKTPLQKAIQILKRHRDIMFKDDTEHLAPISIIITTIAAQLYNNEDNIYDSLKNILANAKDYIDRCKRNDEFYVENPSYTGDENENFADKWNEYPERAEAFIDWLEQAKTNLISSIEMFDDKAEIGSVLGVSLGENVVQRVFSEIDAKTAKSILEETQEKELAFVPRKTQSLLSVPHREKTPWTLPKGYRVLIKATVTDGYGRKYPYKNDGEPLDKAVSIDFTAIFTVSMPNKVKWQVVNTGEDARGKACLRGGFEDSNVGRNTRSEGTEYTGSHYVQCFIIKKGQCVGKSNIFVVNIK
ncbi:MAG: hypothetical protein APF81_17415 [Desulfosporosinus sp. BRH_c37]|nr:MAG: hypothetical protein APF81_17415 [Desulfosporosinus sp. BRH_c37]